jgi:hypothetical protein
MPDRARHQRRRVETNRHLAGALDGGQDFLLGCIQDPRERSDRRGVRPSCPHPAIDAVIRGLRDRSPSPDVAARQASGQAERRDGRMRRIAVEQGKRVDLEDSGDPGHELRLRLLSPTLPMPDPLLARRADPHRQGTLRQPGRFARPRQYRPVEPCYGCHTRDPSPLRSPDESAPYGCSGHGAERSPCRSRYPVRTLWSWRRPAMTSPPSSAAQTTSRPSC